jgi:hypothetical protein
MEALGENGTIDVQPAVNEKNFFDKSKSFWGAPTLGSMPKHPPLQTKDGKERLKAARVPQPTKVMRKFTMAG